MPKAGTWKFKDVAVQGSQIFINLSTGNNSELKAAFATASAALSPADPGTLRGFDPSGRESRYNGSKNYQY